MEGGKIVLATVSNKLKEKAQSIVIFVLKSRYTE